MRHKAGLPAILYSTYCDGHLSYRVYVGSRVTGMKVSVFTADVLQMTQSYSLRCRTGESVDVLRE